MRQNDDCVLREMAMLFVYIININPHRKESLDGEQKSREFDSFSMQKKKKIFKKNN